MPSPLSQANTPSPQTSPNQTYFRSGSSAASRRTNMNYLASPSPANRPSLRNQVSMSWLRRSEVPSRAASTNGDAGVDGAKRPSSALASSAGSTGRRSSLLPRPVTPGGGYKRSSMPIGGLTAPALKDDKPRWRH
jgi:hypothetical protein